MTKAFIFDIDGVITDTKTKKIKELQILDILSHILTESLLILNTGRSLTWIRERVLDPLLAKVNGKNLSNSLFVVGEFGGASLGFDSSGNINVFKDKSIFYDSVLAGEVSEIILNESSESMIFDETKETMITTEMRDGYFIEKYKKAQKKLKSKLKEILKDKKLEDKLDVQSDTIAVNILDKKVGKDYAVKKILDWIKERGLRIDEFTAFGDSISDLDMGKELVKRRYDIKFIYVGTDRLDKKKYKFPIRG